MTFVNLRLLTLCEELHSIFYLCNKDPYWGGLSDALWWVKVGAPRGSIIPGAFRLCFPFSFFLKFFSNLWP